MRSDDPTALSRLFHLNSEPWANEAADPNAPFLQKTKNYPDAPRTALPPTEPGRVATLAAARRSERAFADKPLPLAALASLLQAGYGALGPDPMGDGRSFLRRPTPSAGGLYPLDLYVLARNAEGVGSGAHHFDPVGDALAAIRPDPWEDMAARAFISWREAATAAAIILIGADFMRTQPKYGARGYRFVLLEAGHVAQNICLAAEEAGLATLCLGGFYDSVLNGWIGLDGEREAIVYAIAVGPK